MLVASLTVTKSTSRFTPQFMLAHFLTVTKSASRCMPHKFLLVAFLTVTISASRFTTSISAGRFSDSHQICQQMYPPTTISYRQIFWKSPKSAWQIYHWSLLADLSDFHKIYQQIYHPHFCWTDFLTVTKSASIFTPTTISARQIFWQSPKSARQIYPLISPLVDFSDSHQICQQIYHPIFLLADFLTVTRICW